jgi:hypothetical protein
MTMEWNIIDCPISGCETPCPEIYQIKDDCVHYCSKHGEFRICMDGAIKFKKIRHKQVITWKEIYI